MAAVYVQRVFGQCPGTHFHDHGAEFARCMVILLRAVDQPLSGGKVDSPLSGHRHGNSTALSGVLSFGFDGQNGFTPGRQCSLCICILIIFPHLGRRCNGIEYAAFGNLYFSGSDQLITVGRDPLAGISWFYGALII